MAIKLLLDADLPKALATALRRKLPALDVRRVHDVGLREASDAEILEFAARQGRIVLTRDKSTMRRLAVGRVRDGRAMPGLFILKRGYAVSGTGIGALVKEIELISVASEASEWEGVVHFIPFSSS